MPPVGSDLLMRSLREVAVIATGALFFGVTLFFGAVTGGLTTAFGLEITFGFVTTFGFMTGFGFGLDAVLALGPLPFRASKINCPSWV